MTHPSARRFSVPVFLELVSFDVRLKLLGFRKVCDWVEQCPIAQIAPQPGAIPDVIDTVNRACVYYPKKILCFERSAVVTRLLRRVGVSAKLIIGAQRVPFYMHAWVEVDGSLVDGDPLTRKHLGVLWAL